MQSAKFACNIMKIKEKSCPGVDSPGSKRENWFLRILGKVQSAKVHLKEISEKSKNKKYNICENFLPHNTSNFILKIVCPENEFVDNSKVVLKEIISEDISCNYNADDDILEPSKTTKTIVGSSDSDKWCLTFT